MQKRKYTKTMQSVNYAEAKKQADKNTRACAHAYAHARTDTYKLFSPFHSR